MSSIVWVKHNAEYWSSRDLKYKIYLIGGDEFHVDYIHNDVAEAVPGKQENSAKVKMHVSLFDAISAAEKHNRLCVKPATTQ